MNILIVVLEILMVLVGFATVVVIAKSGILAKQGREYLVMRGNVFHHAIFVVDGWHKNIPGKPYFDDRYPEWEAIPDRWGDPKHYDEHTLFEEEHIDSELKTGKLKGRKGVFTAPQHPLLARMFGWYWIGLWPFNRLYVYEAEWTKEVSKGTQKEGEHPIWNKEAEGVIIVTKKESSNYIPFQYPYPIISDEAETGATLDGKTENIPLRVAVLNTVRARNPVRMMFNTGMWTTNHRSSAKAVLREWIGNKSYEEINKIKNEAGDEDSIADQMRIINSKTQNSNQGVRALFGFEVIMTNFEGHEIVGEDAKSLIKASTKIYIAEQSRKEKEILADGNAAAITKEGQAKNQIKLEDGLNEAKILVAKKEAGLDPNVEVMAEAYGKLTGTLVLGTNGITPTLDVNKTKQKD